MKIDNIIHKGVGIVAFSAIFLLGSCSDDFLREKKDYNGFNDEIYSNFSMAQASVDYIHRQVEPKVGGVSALNGSTGSADEFSKSTLEYAGSTQFVGLAEILSSNVNCYFNYNPQIQISAESETKRSIFREKDKTKRSKKESAQHSKSRNKSFVMTSVSAL